MSRSRGASAHWVCPAQAQVEEGVQTQAQIQGESGVPACTEADPPPQQTATVADVTYPTGMHSCFKICPLNLPMLNDGIYDDSDTKGRCRQKFKTGVIMAPKKDKCH